MIAMRGHLVIEYGPLSRSQIRLQEDYTHVAKMEASDWVMVKNRNSYAGYDKNSLLGRAPVGVRILACQRKIRQPLLCQTMKVQSEICCLYSREAQKCLAPSLSLWKRSSLSELEVIL